MGHGIWRWWGCGGSLIGRGWVLTAADCVTSYGYVVPASIIGAAIGRHNLHSQEGVVIGASTVLADSSTAALPNTMLPCCAWPHWRR